MFQSNNHLRLVPVLVLLLPIVLVLVLQGVQVEGLTSNEKFNKRMEKFASNAAPVLPGARTPISLSMFTDRKEGGNENGSENGSENVEEKKETTKEQEVLEDGNDDLQEDNEDSTTIEEEMNGLDLSDEVLDGDEGGIPSMEAGAVASTSSPSTLLGLEETSDYVSDDIDIDSNINSNIDTRTNNNDDEKVVETVSSVTSLKRAASTLSPEVKGQISRVAIPAALMTGISLFGVSVISSAPPTSTSTSSSYTPSSSYSKPKPISTSTSTSTSTLRVPPPASTPKPKPKTTSNRMSKSAASMSTSFKRRRAARVVEEDDDVPDEIVPIVTILKVFVACVVASQI
jgi:hypothetical protein